MKKSIIVILLGVMLVGSAIADNNQAQATTNSNNAQQQQTQTNDSDTQAAKQREQQMNPFQATWDWTKSTATKIKEKTSPALESGWSWSRDHIVKIGKGFKDGGVAFYNEVTGKGDKKDSNGASSASNNDSQTQQPTGNS